MQIGFYFDLTSIEIKGAFEHSRIWFLILAAWPAHAPSSEKLSYDHVHSRGGVTRP